MAAESASTRSARLLHDDGSAGGTTGPAAAATRTGSRL